ncbi:MAG: glycosyltransferase family 4 protein [Bdellovibrionota bacterium]
MPFGTLPTSGGGLRCYQLMRGLEARGIEVIASMPGFTYLAEKHAAEIPQEQREWLWQWHTQDELLRRAKPDAVMFASNWDHFNLTKPYDVPLIVDLHGSRLIETTMWNSPASTDKKVDVFSRADCLLCAGQRQRSYFYGWLLQAGRVPADEHFIRYIPISLSPDLPTHLDQDQSDSRSPVFVSGGGWFPWQNQSKTIFAICERVSSSGRGSIKIYGTPHETNNLSAEEKMIREVYARVKQLSSTSDRIEVKGYIGRDELIQVYRKASVAVEAMQYNLERELAFTTRTIEYLWCGLPVLYNDYSEISDHIRDYDAGWTIDPNNDGQIAETIEEILSQPQLVRQKSANAQQLVRDRFLWDRTIQPLVDFLNNPVKAARVQPVSGVVCARPSFLSPRGATLDVRVTEESGSVSQRFLVPAESITIVSLPIVLPSEASKAAISNVQLRVRTPEGKTLCRKSFSGKDLPLAGQLELQFSRLRPPPGGKELILDIAVAGKGRHAALFVQGLLNPTFPFLTDQSGKLVGKSFLGEEIPVGAVALHFLPGTGRLFQIQLLATRGLEMVRRGEWRRFGRAVANRLPGFMQRARQMIFRFS